MAAGSSAPELCTSIVGERDDMYYSLIYKLQYLPYTQVTSPIVLLCTRYLIYSRIHKYALLVYLVN